MTAAIKINGGVEATVCVQIVPTEWQIIIAVPVLALALQVVAAIHGKIDFCFRNQNKINNIIDIAAKSCKSKHVTNFSQLGCSFVAKNLKKKECRKVHVRANDVVIVTIAEVEDRDLEVAPDQEVIRQEYAAVMARVAVKENLVGVEVQRVIVIGLLLE